MSFKSIQVVLHLTSYNSFSQTGCSFLGTLYFAIFRCDICTLIDNYCFEQVRSSAQGICLSLLFLLWSRVVCQLAIFSVKRSRLTLCAHSLIFLTQWI